ncbi:MAG: transcriptional repressor [Spirochaetes bacterium]|nr:transcriptional repressor [Spirochaetota bacterium]
MKLCCNSKDILKSSHLKATEKRLKLLNLILTRASSFSAGQLFDDIQHILAIDLATIYRILQIFEEKNIIRKVVEKNGVQYYESACEHQPEHSHFICESCDQIICLKDLKENEQDFIKKLDIPYDVSRITLFVKGICNKCKESDEQ